LRIRRDGAVRRAALAFLAAGAALAAGAGGVGAQDGAPWDSLAAGIRAARRSAREARLVLDPRAILASERELAGRLEAAAEALPGDPADLPAGSPSFVFALLQLLGARNPAVERWLEGLDPAALERVDPGGELVFWSGCLALDAGRWARACDRFEGPVAAPLRDAADWLRVQALEKLDRTRAGETAVEVLGRAPWHAFAGGLSLRAGRHLLETRQDSAALVLLRAALDGPSLGNRQRAGVRTLIAEIHHRRGDEARARAEFLIAAQLSTDAAEEGPLRLAQAQRILEAAEAPGDAATALRVTLRLAGARDGHAAYARWRARLTPEERTSLLGVLLEKLYRARADDELARLTDELRATGRPAERTRAALYAGRVWKRRRDLPRLVEAYRAAAAPSDSGVALGDEQRQDGAQALWEMGRELQDAERWPEAVAAFAELRRRFPGEANAVDAGVQEALSLWHAGDSTAARARLEILCREAPSTKVGAPCLWRALLGPPAERVEFLGHAVAETNPGYYAFRARGEILTPAAVDSAPGGYWAALAAQVRQRSSWDWPSNRRRASPQLRRWLDRLEEDSRADHGVLFLARGQRERAHDLWMSLPGWRELHAEDRAAVLRALGDIDAATREAIDGGSPTARYPVAYAADVAAAAERFDLSPAFVLAIMRQESLLNPQALSGAGAQGLMQLMPATARRMADSLGWRAFDLGRTADNVMLGACHLAELLDATAGEVPVALAGYNAGLGRARAWRRTARDLDDFIERIGFPETRRFVRSVLMHYSFYRELYPRRASDAAGD
jgi:hypothetical protein